MKPQASISLNGMWATYRSCATDWNQSKTSNSSSLTLIDAQDSLDNKHERALPTRRIGTHPLTERRLPHWVDEKRFAPI